MEDCGTRGVTRGESRGEAESRTAGVEVERRSGEQEQAAAREKIERK